jgi:RHS repeat-associated protein
LGTRLVTNNADTTSFEQSNLPYGTALDTESPGATRRFTSYDRSSTTGLDYAVNRHYDSRQGRFTQPDPIGLNAASLADPQSLNMYSYVGNDPINRVDPDGQFWGALFRFIGGLFRNLKPNIINGSFAYGNRPPVSVSFTTNFQNVGVGYGGVGVQLRGGGQWLPDLVGHRHHAGSADQFGGSEPLSECLRNNLRRFFPQQSAQGRMFSPIDDARFRNWIPARFPFAAKVVPGVVNPAAIVLGIWDIHYDPKKVKLNGGTSQNLKTILEEISHVVQFLQVWDRMQPNPLTEGKYGLNSRDYDNARQAWAHHYFRHGLKAGGYVNEVEKWAQNNANSILSQIVYDPQLQKKGDLCGYNLRYYKIEYVR